MIQIKTKKGFLLPGDLEFLGNERTTLQYDYFHDHRGITIHCPWEREKIDPENIYAGWGFKGFKKGDKFSVSITSRVDDRLAGGWQSDSETFEFQIDNIDKDTDEVEVTELNKTMGCSKYYPDYGKN